MGSNLALKPGSEVDYGERRFAIMQVISFETVVARDVETGELERLPIGGLRSISAAAPSVPPPDLSELDGRDWNEARRRLDLIQPVLDAARLPRSVMSERARDAGVEVTRRSTAGRACIARLGCSHRCSLQTRRRSRKEPARTRRRADCLADDRGALLDAAAAHDSVDGGRGRTPVS